MLTDKERERRHVGQLELHDWYIKNQIVQKLKINRNSITNEMIEDYRQTVLKKRNENELIAQGFRVCEICDEKKPLEAYVLINNRPRKRCKLCTNKTRSDDDRAKATERRVHHSENLTDSHLKTLIWKRTGVKFNEISISKVETLRKQIQEQREIQHIKKETGRHRCSTCKEFKPLTEFRVRCEKGREGKPISRCHTCDREYHNERNRKEYRENESYRESRKAYEKARRPFIPKEATQRWRKKYKQKSIGGLTDAYVRERLYSEKDFPIPVELITPDLIELKRKQLKLHRDVKKRENEQYQRCA